MRNKIPQFQSNVVRDKDIKSLIISIRIANDDVDIFVNYFQSRN